MKLTIEGVEYEFPKLSTWSYDEAHAALRVSGLTAGKVWGQLMEGNPSAHLAIAVVAFVRAHPDRDPMELKIGKNIDHSVVHLFEKGKKDSGGGDGDPPAGGGSAPPNDDVEIESESAEERSSD